MIMLKTSTVIALVIAAAGCAASDETSDSSEACELAAQHVSECTGEQVDATSLKDCDAERAEQLIGMDCSTVSQTAAAGKADGWWDPALCSLGLLCHCAAVGHPWQQLTIDVSDTSPDAYVWGRNWDKIPSGGYNNSIYYKATVGHKAHAYYTPPLAERANYSVKAYIPPGAGADVAEYAIFTCHDNDNGYAPSYNVDVSKSGWVDVGTFNLAPGAYIALWGERNAFVADALQFTKQ
jgi:hypothetical protein